MNEVISAIKSRRSVRKYKSEQISKESLDIIIEAAVYAPSAGNDQPWHFTVIQNKEILNRINEIVREEMAKSSVDWVKRMGENPHFKVTYDAPTLIIVSGEKDATAPEADCDAAIENMLIAAESLSVGTVWLGLIRHLFARPGEAERLGIPEGYEPRYGVALGYADGKKPVAPQRNMNVVNYVL